MDKYQAFEKLKELSQDLSSVSYKEIFDLLKDGIKQIPIPLAKISKKTNIDRVRANNGENLFNHIDELGYIKDKKVISGLLTNFGRANCPHQVMFYGALETSLIGQQRYTALAETSRLFRDPTSECLDGEHYTVSRWETTEDFLVVEIVFSEYALKNNPEIVTSFENQKKFLKEHQFDDKEMSFHLDFLKFISEEFSKKVNNPDEYKISAAYTNIAFMHPDVKGISYPSVQTEYFGLNIVMPPDSVDRLLIPKICSTHTVYKKGQKSLMTNGRKYCNTIDHKQNIDWQDADPSILTDRITIAKYLD